MDGFGKLKDVSSQPASTHILDLWIMSRFNWLLEYVTRCLKNYNAKDAALEIEKFVDDLSTWYIRRSRDRIWVNSDDQKDKGKFYQTLHVVLVNLSILLSPFMPFISEEIYTSLTGNESVHLSLWPQVNQKSIDEKIMADMGLVREIAEAGQRTRKVVKIKVRQPLSVAIVYMPDGKKFEDTTHTE